VTLVRREPLWPPSRPTRLIERAVAPFVKIPLPRGAGIAATTFVILGSLSYGVIKGDHAAIVVDAFKDVRDQAANAAGFQIASLGLSGNQHVSQDDILAAAGISGRTSLLFLDVEATRARLKTHAWIADATVLKFLPGELQIRIKERIAFALWQKDGRVSVVADDGTVLESSVEPQLRGLPLVVGPGAERRAKEFLALLERYPDIREQVRASILVGERRWNLRLRNGLDVRLPEINMPAAFDRLVALDRDVKLISRDVAVIDLRLADRVTVRLSPAAAQARADALKEKKPAKKGGPA
jgi:cell division protein FtsQ